MFKYNPSIKELVLGNVYLSLLSEAYSVYSAYPTQEARNVFASALLEELRDINEVPQLSLVERGKNQDSSDWDYYVLMEKYIKKMFVKDEFLLREQLSLVDLIENKRHNVEYLKNYILQRVALLKDNGRNDFKFSWTDNFYDATMSKKTSCVAKDGFLTLPQVSKTTIVANKISIGSKSNGFAGSGEAGTGVSLNSLIKQTDDYFEYRNNLDVLFLELIVEFDVPKIINSIELQNNLIDDSSEYKVGRIISSFNGKDIDVLQYHPPFSKRVRNENWQTIFYPTETKSLRILLECGSKSLSQNRASSNVISLKSIVCSAIKYSNAGVHESIAINMPSGLYLVKPKIKLLDVKQDFYNYEIKMQTSDGEFILSEPLPLNGTAEQNYISLSISRNDDAFNKLDSFYNDEEVTDVKTTARSFDYRIKPNYLSIDRSFDKDTLYLYLPDLLLLNREDKLPLKRVSSGSSYVDLNFSLNELDSDLIHVYLDDVEQTYVDGAPAVGEWSLTENGKNLILGDVEDLEKNVSIRIDAEEVLFDYADGRYTYQPKFSFDPDKDNLNLVCFSSKLESQIKILPTDRTFVNLGVKNIAELTVSSNATAYTEVADKASLTLNNYYVNYKEGFLWLSEETNTTTLSVVVKAFKEETIDKSKFNIEFNGNRPDRISIDKDSISAIDAQDEIGSNLRSTTSLLSGLTAPRATAISAGNTRTKTLSYKNILKGSLYVSSDLFDETYGLAEEIDFIDGKKEFLGLIEMQNEYTNNQVADADGLVSFYLSARDLVYLPYGVVFSDTSVFTLKKLSLGAIATVGDYFIDNDGLVTVKVGADATASLVADININYFYKDREFKPDNKYSVDYRNGYLYSYTPMTNGAFIYYKAATYILEYAAVRPVAIKNVDVNNRKVTFFTNVKSKIVKAAWLDRTVKEGIGKFSNYFTPIVFNYGIECF